MFDQMKILIVDDNTDNVEILNEYLVQFGCMNRNISIALDGLTALEILQKKQDYDLILLDRMMPGMDGIEVLKEMQCTEELRHIPVIFQSAKSDPKQIQEGFDAGARYYLSKPFSQEEFKNILGIVLRDRAEFKTMQTMVHKLKQDRANQMRNTFRWKISFVRPDEARSLAPVLASIFPHPEASAIGFLELMLNAIEHGNLGISYDEKSNLMELGTFEEEVERRLCGSDKYATLDFFQSKEKIQVVITDQGNGFDWTKYLNFDSDRASHAHGRGIAMANHVSGFDLVEYQGNGNEVVVTVLKSD